MIQLLHIPAQHVIPLAILAQALLKFNAQVAQFSTLRMNLAASSAPPLLGSSIQSTAPQNALKSVAMATSSVANWNVMMETLKEEMAVAVAARWRMGTNVRAQAPVNASILYLQRPR